MLALLRLRLGDAVVDEILFVDRPERGLSELHLHGAPAVIDALEAAVGGFAPESVAPPERLLREAVSEPQLELALEQQAVEAWPAFVARIRTLPLAARRAAVDAARARSRTAIALSRRRSCVLVGRQNAGKSTLFNRLLLTDRALAGPRAGLTRDPVRDATLLAGYPYELVDTAGSGAVTDPVDRAAQGLAARAAQGALRVLVCDGSQPFRDLAAAATATLVVRNKSDLGERADWPALPRPVVELSCLDPRGAAAIRARIGEALRGARGLPPAPARGVGGPAALEERQLAELDDLLPDATRDATPDGG